MNEPTEHDTNNEMPEEHDERGAPEEVDGPLAWACGCPMTCDTTVCDCGQNGGMA